MAELGGVLGQHVTNTLIGTLNKYIFDKVLVSFITKLEKLAFIFPILKQLMTPDFYFFLNWSTQDSIPSLHV